MRPVGIQMLQYSKESNQQNEGSLQNRRNSLPTVCTTGDLYLESINNWENYFKENIHMASKYLKLFNIFSCWRNANEKHREILSHASQKDSYQENKVQQSLLYTQRILNQPTTGVHVHPCDWHTVHSSQDMEPAQRSSCRWMMKKMYVHTRESDSERQILHVFPHMENLHLNSHTCDVWDIEVESLLHKGRADERGRGWWEGSGKDHWQVSTNEVEFYMYINIYIIYTSLYIYKMSQDYWQVNKSEVKWYTCMKTSAWNSWLCMLIEKN